MGFPDGERPSPAMSRAAAAGAPGIDTQLVVGAVQREICFETYWGNRDTYRLGQTATLTVRRQRNDMAYVWSEQLSRVPHVSAWGNFYSVFVKDGEAAVGTSNGYNLDRSSQKPWVFDDEQQTVQIQIPADCTPHFLPETPLKTQMLDLVTSSIAKELQVFNKYNGVGAHYSGGIRIVIANFNTDYPETYVTIPSIGLVFTVTLHASIAPLADLPTDGYEMVEIYGEENKARANEKIQKYGIDREVL
jgi:hypothetical protein